MIVSITGFMGCGKSSVGRRLSELLCCRFMDLDEVIVKREGRSIREIFAEDGEGEFRRIEKEALEDVLETDGRALEIPKTPALVTLPARCKGPLDHLPSRSRPLAGDGMSHPYIWNLYTIFSYQYAECEIDISGDGYFAGGADDRL